MLLLRGWLRPIYELFANPQEISPGGSVHGRISQIASPRYSLLNAAISRNEKGLTMISKDTVEPSRLLSSNCSRVFPIIKEISSLNSLTFASCLDIGSANRPCKQWFERFEHSIAPRSYVGTDTDPVLVERGLAAGIDIVDPSKTDRELSGELVVALEVLEHIPAAGSRDFLRYCADRTRKLFALTTPNFEYFNGKRPTDAELRWIPDHLINLNPASANPHVHKQAITPQILSDYMSDCFESNLWEWQIYRAWPWEITDLSKDLKFKLYFKLFAVAWKKNAPGVPSPMAV